MTTKTDLRIKKTNYAIKTAFWQLLYTEDYSKITVRQILNLANVNHATFYKHYANKDDLLTAIEDDLLSEFKKVTLQVPTPLITQKTETEQPQMEYYYQQLVLYIYRNGKKFSTLLDSTEDRSFINKLIETDQEIWQEKHLLEQLAIPQRYASTALVGMALNLISEWVKSDFQETPQEFLAIMKKLLTPFFSDGILFYNDK
ncbi:TetR/AcrR family transcriptional regulator [Weissella paramesenteroides]|uniref:TetR/AcrR family transcriptional regulator n=1 Tax=Weissella paramesenteroides TaxID=1249 RepID=UPI003F7458A2